MPQPLISFPFRLTGAGAVATRDDGTEDYYGDELAMLVMTLPGERELVPTYGMDVAFNEVDVNELQTQVEVFGPPVQIVSVTNKFVSSTDLDVTIYYRQVPLEGYDNYEIGDA